MPGISFGQTRDNKLSKDPYYFAAVCSAVGATLVDGSKLICKAGGTAWFVAPLSNGIETGVIWAAGCYSGCNVSRCCITDWGVLDACLSANVACYVTTQWFVPTCTQLNNPMYCCRANWNYNCGACYWSSTSTAGDGAIAKSFYNNSTGATNKGYAFAVRALRCVTY